MMKMYQEVKPLRSLLDDESFNTHGEGTMVKLTITDPF